MVAKFPFKKFFPSLFALPREIKLVSLVVFIYFLGWGIVNPFLPLYFNKLLGSYSAVGFIFALPNFLALFWALLLGTFLDRLTKKHLLSFVLLLYFPFSLILLSLKTLLQFVYFRVYHSLISTAFWLTSEAYLRQHSQKGKEARAIGLYDFSTGLSAVLGALLGAFLILKFDFSIIYAISIAAFFAFFFSFFLPDKRKNKMLDGIKYSLKNGFLKKEFQNFFRNSKLIRLSIFAFFFSFCLSFLPLILPLFSEAIGASYFQIGLIAALFNLPILFEPYFSAFKKRTIFWGLLFSSLFFFLLFLVKEVKLVFLLALLLGISLAAVNPLLQGLITRTMPKKEIGQLSGVSFATRVLAVGLGSLTAGFISDLFGLNYVFLLGFIIFILMIVFIKQLIKD